MIGRTLSNNMMGNDWTDSTILAVIVILCNNFFNLQIGMYSGQPIKTYKKTNISLFHKISRPNNVTIQNCRYFKTISHLVK